MMKEKCFLELMHGELMINIASTKNKYNEGTGDVKKIKTKILIIHGKKD